MIEKRFTRSKSLDGDCTIYDELNDFEFPSLPQGVSEIFVLSLMSWAMKTRSLNKE